EQNPAPLRAPPGHLLPVGVEPFLAAVLPEVHEQRVGLARPTGADVDRLKKWTFEKRHLGTGLGSPGDLDLAAAMVPRDWLELPVLDPPFDVAVQAHSSRTPCVEMRSLGSTGSSQWASQSRCRRCCSDRLARSTAMSSSYSAPI